MFAPPEPSVTDHIKGTPTLLDSDIGRIEKYLRLYADNFSHRVANILYPENIDHIDLASAQFAAQFPWSSELPRQILSGDSNTPVQFFCQSFNPMQGLQESQPYVTLSIGELSSYREKCDVRDLLTLLRKSYEEIRHLMRSEWWDRFVYASIENHLNTLLYTFSGINDALHIEAPSPRDIEKIIEQFNKDLLKSKGSNEQNNQIRAYLEPCIAAIKKYQQHISQYYHAKFSPIQHQSKLGKEANAIISLDNTSTYIQKLLFAVIHENRYNEWEHSLVPILAHLQSWARIKPVYITQIEVAPSSKWKGYSKALLDGIAWVSEHGTIIGDLTYAIVEWSNPEKEKMISSFQKTWYQIYKFNKHSIHTEERGIAYLALRINPKSPIAKITEK